MSRVADFYTDVHELAENVMATTQEFDDLDAVAHETVRYTEEAGWKSPTEWAAYRGQLLAKIRGTVTAADDAGVANAQWLALNYALTLFGISHADLHAVEDVKT